MTDVCDIEFLTIEEAAELLRVKPGTLDNWRSEKEGPPHRRHGARIVYERTELLKWSEERRARTPPSDERTKSPARRDGDAGGCILAIAFPVAKAPRIVWNASPSIPIGRLRSKLTIVAVEHDMEFLFKLADRISVIHWGQVVARGSPGELQQNEWVKRSNLGRFA